MGGFSNTPLARSTRDNFGIGMDLGSGRLWSICRCRTADK